jgi:hypothetical protein
LGPAREVEVAQKLKTPLGTGEIMFGFFACPMCRPSTQKWGLIHNLNGHVIAFSGSDLGVVL